MKKTIPLRDFIYLCIILTIILITVTTLMLSNEPTANENLNFSATLISIVLAVIAIIFTIVDSSGQKQNVLLMRENIEELDDSVKNINNIVHSLNSQLGQVQEIKGEMVVFEEWRGVMLSKIEELLKTTQGDQKNDINVAEQLKETLKNTPTSFMVPNSLKKVGWNIIDMLDDQYHRYNNNGWSLFEIYKLYNEMYPDNEVLINSFRRIIERLINEGHIYLKEEKLFRKIFEKE